MAAPYNMEVVAQPITVEGNVNDNLNSMRWLIARLAPMREAASGDSLTLGLSKLRYLGPYGATIIAGSVMRAREAGVHVGSVWPSEPAPLVAFLEFSGLKAVLLKTVISTSDNPENVTVPLRRFDESFHGDAQPIIQLVERFASLSEDTRISLEIAVNEAVQNISDHSSSSIGGWGCARFMATRREVRVALADWGDGILKTLRRKHPDTKDDEHALSRVLFGGYSARSRVNNQGRGIDNLRSVVVQAAGGSVSIISGEMAVEVRGKPNPMYCSLSRPFQGTVVCFTVPLKIVDSTRRQ